MARRKKQSQNTKAEAMRTYLRKNPEATRREFIADTGIEVGGGHFSNVRSAVRSAVHSEVPNGTDIEVLLRDTNTKLDEYRYRCWKLEGEKFGYVQRLKGESS